MADIVLIGYLGSDEKGGWTGKAEIFPSSLEGEPTSVTFKRAKEWLSQGEFLVSDAWIVHEVDVQGRLELIPEIIVARAEVEIASMDNYNDEEVDDDDFS